MKCPICGGEMQRASLGSVTDIVWTPQAGKIKEAAEYKRSGTIGKK